MAFIDEVELNISSGNGGNGIISFLHLLYNEKAGPDGGNGGNGGSIILKLDNNLNDLEKLTHNINISASNGDNGKSKRKNGKNGEDKIIFLPENTYVYNNSKLVIVINNNCKEYRLLKGGIGGKGNYHFRSSINRTPRICENGELGKKSNFKFVLKISAEFGIIGMPNSGKSTFINSITNAKSLIGNYEFTTLKPIIGVINNKHKYKILDIPGIIKDAHKNKGLGLQFLQHIEVCKNLIFFLDGTKNPIEQFKILNNEIFNYKKSILLKNFYIFVNKIDLLNEEKINHIRSKYKMLQISNKLFFISAKKEMNLKKSVNFICEDIICNKIISNDEDQYVKIDLRNKAKNDLNSDIIIKKVNENTFVVFSKPLQYVTNKIPLYSYQNIIRYNVILKKMNLFKLLRDKGARPGDKIIIYENELEFL